MNGNGESTFHGIVRARAANRQRRAEDACGHRFRRGAAGIEDRHPYPAYCAPARHPGDDGRFRGEGGARGPGPGRRGCAGGRSLRGGNRHPRIHLAGNRHPPPGQAPGRRAGRRCIRRRRLLRELCHRARRRGAHDGHRRDSPLRAGGRRLQHARLPAAGRRLWVDHVCRRGRGRTPGARGGIRARLPRGRPAGRRHAMEFRGSLCRGNEAARDPGKAGRGNLGSGIAAKAPRGPQREAMAAARASSAGKGGSQASHPSTISSSRR